MNRYSFWEEDAFLAPVDVIIAGAGFAGLWTAWHLLKAKPGLRVRILEKSLLPSGASTRNAGFACFGSLTELVADAKHVGETAMQDLVSLRWEGLQMLNEVLPQHEIDYIRVGGFELIPPGKFDAVAGLSVEIDRINELLKDVIGTRQVFRNVPEQLHEARFSQTQFLVENTFEGQLHPGKVVKALLSRLQILGADVKFGVDVKQYAHSNDSFFVETSVGQMNCRQFVICTNAFAPALSKDISVIPARGQLLLTSPLPEIRFRGCFHADEGFIYFRNLDNRILLGGARNTAFSAEESLEAVVTEKVQQELENYLSRVILPGMDVQIERRWSGIMGMSSSRAPVVKQLEAGVFTAVAMGGIGVAAGPVIGRKAAELVLNS